MIGNPKICFTFTSGSDTVRVWGRCDFIERTPGMWPNVVELHVPKHEFSKFNGDAIKTGNLELYLSDDSEPDVTLKWWSVDHVQDSISATQVAGETAEVVGKVLVLLDRRWEFQRGLGGCISRRGVNESLGTNGAITNQQNNFSANFPDGAPYFELLTVLVARMQYASGGPQIDRDFFPAALADLTPRDLDWSNVHRPTEIQRLLEEARAVWTVRCDGEYIIYMINDGSLPSLKDPWNPEQPAEQLPSDDNKCRTTRPQTVIITSAPQRVINQTTLTGPGDSTWQWVGLETDGPLKPLTELSYFKDTDRSLEGFVGSRFKDLYQNDEAFGLTMKSFFRMLRFNCNEIERTRYLPFLERIVEIVDDAGEIKRIRPFEIRAKYAYQRSGGWYTHNELTDITGYSVDCVNGIITFDRMLGKVEYDGAASMFNDFKQLADGDLEITFAYEMNEHWDYRDFYNAAYTLDANGDLMDWGVEEALDPTSKRVVQLSFPELCEFRIEGETQNKEALDTRAEEIAARILAGSDEVRTLVYKGFHDVSPNGVISRVRWDLRACTTSFDYQSYHYSRDRYALEKSQHALAHQSQQGQQTATHSAAQASRSAGPHASRTYTVPGNSQPLGGDNVFWAKLTAAWSTGNSVTANPCDDHLGAEPDTTVTLTLFAASKWNKSPSYVELREGDVVAYLPFGVNQGVLVNSLHAGTAASLKQIYPSTAGSESQETAYTDTWDRTNQGSDDGLKIWQQTRTFYSHTGSKKLYAFYREFCYDSAGMVKSISAETRIEVDDTGPC